MKRKSIVLLSVLLVVFLMTLYILFYVGVFVNDYSLKLMGEGRLMWQGRLYTMVGQDVSVHSGRVLTKSEDGWYKGRRLKGDRDNNFLVINYSFFETRVYKLADYEMPKDGRITMIVVDRDNYNRYKSGRLLRAIRSAIDNSDESFIYESPELTTPSENYDFKYIAVAYNNCPYTSTYGYIGKLEGEWVYISNKKMLNNVNPDNDDFKYQLTCHKIPEKYWKYLERNFKKL